MKGNIIKSANTSKFSSIFLTVYLPGNSKTALTVEEFELFANTNIAKDEFGRWTCNLCGLQAGAKTHLVRHLEAKQVILPPISCPICYKTCKTSHSMRMHMKNYHDAVPGQL